MLVSHDRYLEAELATLSEVRDAIDARAGTARSEAVATMQ